MGGTSGACGTTMGHEWSLRNDHAGRSGACGTTMGGTWYPCGVDILAARTILRPVDYRTTVEFYRDGLSLAVCREYPGGTVFFAGQSLLEIAAHHRSDDAHGSFSGALWLQVRDIDSAAAELTAAGIPITREARTEPWGLIEMWTEDPDGIPIVLVQVPHDHPLRRDTR